jgi:hypothetical protein
MQECSTVGRGAKRRHKSSLSRRERGVRSFGQNDSVIPHTAALLADLDTYAAAGGRERAK